MGTYRESEIIYEPFITNGVAGHIDITVENVRTNLSQDKYEATNKRINKKDIT